MAKTLPRTLRRLARPAQRVSPGSAPGMLQHNPLSYPTKLLAVGFGPEGFIERPCETVEELRDLAGAWPVMWVQVCGFSDIALIERLGEFFGLDRLSLEDVLDTSHRPKVEFYENYIFTIVKGGTLGEEFEAEQICLFLKKNTVISFQESPVGGFEQVRERIRRGTGKIRHLGPDYLYYALLDEVIDRYFPVLDRVNYLLARIEEQMVTERREDMEIIQRIHHAKSDLLLLHRTIWPISDIVGVLMREDTALVTKSTRTYLRDCFDHSVQANELTQFYRDTASGLLNTYLAYEGHKTNEIVKVLTMVSAVFIPLNLIASLYGMNFHHMPELDWRYGYPLALSLMLAVALAMLAFFYRKGWIRSKLPENKG